MLIRFLVSNFLSFDEETEFNMLPSSLKTHKHHVYKTGRVEVLKAAAIYGANGAGKSNLIQAIDTLKAVVHSGSVDDDFNELKFRLNKMNGKKPISLEIEFSIEKRVFSYGVVIDATDIMEEWLYESGITTSDKLIFERTLTKDHKVSIKMAEKYRKTEKERLLIELMEENLLKNNELFLGKSDSLKIREISMVRTWFEHRLFLIFPETRFDNLVTAMVNMEKFERFVNETLETVDTGVAELGIETIQFDKFFGEADEKTKTAILNTLRVTDSIPYRYEDEVVVICRENNDIVVKRVISKHRDNNGHNIVFELFEESDGTQRLLDLLPAFYDTLELDITYIIDEIDRSIHPALLHKLTSKIMANETTKGQLIFTTHESNLLDLDIFRQDEIWFAEKDKITGSTQLYSLSDYKPRFDLDIRKGYLRGRFGAIPFLANVDSLNWHEHGAQAERL